MKENFTVKLIVATHKKYRMPVDDMYLPLHVGAEGKKVDLGYVKDNTGDNISDMNASFCELTGLYWAWKNVKADYIGLVHYRRHFAVKKSRDSSFAQVLTFKELNPYIDTVRLFVPTKRKYYIETIYSHYAHTHYMEQLDETRKIIALKYPEYFCCFDKVMRQRGAYMFNMMIMERALLDEYCTWLFDILFELKRCYDEPELSAFQGRFYGRISEILFNVWLNYKLESNSLKFSEVMELPYVYMEKINWRRKILSFMKAKLFGVKYQGSF